MIKQLIKLANHLDSKGLTKEADELDSIIFKIAEIDEGERDLIISLTKMLNDPETKVWKESPESWPESLGSVDVRECISKKMNDWVLDAEASTGGLSTLPTDIYYDPHLLNKFMKECEVELGESKDDAEYVDFIGLDGAPSKMPKSIIDEIDRKRKEREEQEQISLEKARNEPTPWEDFDF
jgi:hypothetical protein